jgi:hypothetical protein
VGEAVADVAELALLDVCDHVSIDAALALLDDATPHSPCLIGLNASSLEISILALVQRGTSTTTRTVSLSPSYRKPNVFLRWKLGLTVQDGLLLIGEEGDVAEMSVLLLLYESHSCLPTR